MIPDLPGAVESYHDPRFPPEHRPVLKLLDLIRWVPLDLAAVAGIFIVITFGIFYFTQSIKQTDVTIEAVPLGSFLPDASQRIGDSYFLTVISVIPKDAIPAILEPEFAPPLAVEVQMKDTEQVIGVSINGDARAYPINVLSRHEIVNDIVGGEPIAVTWCPLCYSGIVYARRFGDETLTFGVSGKLILNALVMYDHQTDSLWSHFTGDAITGSFLGTKLEILPAMQTTWKRWRELYPDTLVLDKGVGYLSDRYRSYYNDSNTGIFEETRSDDRLYKKEFVIGLLIDSKAKAYAFRDLNDQPVVDDSFAGSDLVVTFDSESATGGIFSRNVAGRTLTFQPTDSPELGSPLMVDDETGSLWLMLTGEAIDGELVGTKLEQIPSNYAFWFAWKDWHPSTQLFLGDDPPF